MYSNIRETNDLATVKDSGVDLWAGQIWADADFLAGHHDKVNILCWGVDGSRTGGAVRLWESFLSVVVIQQKAVFAKFRLTGDLGRLDEQEHAF